MARKPRDYKAEYKRRLARAAQLGYSKSVARGHAPKGTVSLKVAKRFKVLPGSRTIDIPFHPTGREIDQSQVDRERENLIREGFNLRSINKLDLWDEKSFIQFLLEAGYTPHEAYTLRFS